ncbi:MAG: hypothetical protein JOY70_05695 [Acidisphaera sp.]|nr:hypothetical protein [Acidisphaera sp.]
MIRSTLVLLALSLAPTLAAAQPKNPSFNLVNTADKPIREFFATPAGMENWGQNRLEGKTVPASGAIPVRLRADGNCLYDLRVVFADGRAEERRHVDTCRVDDVRVGTPAAASHEASFRLINRGKSPVAEVYATPAGAGKAGDNLLADGATLAPDESRLFRVAQGGSGGQGGNQAANQCNYDLRVVFANKQSREKKNADLCHTGDLPVQ